MKKVKIAQLIVLIIAAAVIANIFFPWIGHVPWFADAIFLAILVVVLITLQVLYESIGIESGVIRQQDEHGHYVDINGEVQSTNNR